MRHYRRVIQIRAEDSPNVKLALRQRELGQEITGQQILPGVLSWDEYKKRRATWDKVRQCIGLDAEFYEGSELLLYPPDWLNASYEAARSRPAATDKSRRWLGCDPAEGGDKSSWAVTDAWGLLDLVSLKTPDTNFIPRQTLALMAKWNVQAEDAFFDAGGGGKQHADRLRDMGHEVCVVRFGESLSLDPKRGVHQLGTRVEIKEERYVYLNRRAQMYGELSELMDPAREDGVFAIPAHLGDARHGDSCSLREQLAPMPKLYDKEGRQRMLPKNKQSEDSKEKTLVELIGHSPDEADALVLSVHARLHPRRRTAMAGAVT